MDLYAKWNFFERQVLKLYKKIVVKHSDELFCIALWIKHFIEQKYNKPVTCNPTGIGNKKIVVNKELYDSTQVTFWPIFSVV